MSGSSSSFRSLGDRALGAALALSALLAGIVTLLILAFLLRESWAALRSIGVARFFGDPGWYPTQGQFNVVPMLAGTLLVAGSAVLVTALLGLLVAVFSRYYAPSPLARALRVALELMAGVPSVVYGFWGLTVLVPFLGAFHPPGQSLLAGAAILSVMVLPTIALLAEASLAAVPAETLRGAEALGLGRWRTVAGVALPAARSGIATAVILGLGRAVGETMAVLMVCGNVVRVPEGFLEPVRTLTANVALEMAYATGDHRSALFVTGLFLMLMIVALMRAASAIRARAGA